MEKAILKKQDRTLEALKSIAKDIQKQYTGNIKIEVDVNKKIGNAKVKITEHLE